MDPDPANNTNALMMKSIMSGTTANAKSSEVLKRCIPTARQMPDLAFTRLVPVTCSTACKHVCANSDAPDSVTVKPTNRLCVAG